MKLHKKKHFITHTGNMGLKHIETPLYPDFYTKHYSLKTYIKQFIMTYNFSI
ncbi:hypothetical protein HDE70_004522 [Pedobacter cryoconitis]|nr:hypothetical protein [Pedobacter cryoconitis]